MKLNPEGFRYESLYSGQEPAVSFSEETDTWFVQDYSRTAPEEDRAALWALRFAVTDPLWWEDHPRLKNKLMAMEAEMAGIWNSCYISGMAPARILPPVGSSTRPSVAASFRIRSRVLSISSPPCES